MQGPYLLRIVGVSEPESDRAGRPRQMRAKVP